MKLITLTAVAILCSIITLSMSHCPTRYAPPPCVAQTITWQLTTVQSAQILPNSTDSTEENFGQILPFRVDLFDASGTIGIGKTQGLCTIVGSADEGNTTLLECTYTFYITDDDQVPTSSVNVAGQYRFNAFNETVDIMSITGGTGRFTGAKGTVEQHTFPGVPITFTNILKFYSSFTDGCCT